MKVSNFFVDLVDSISPLFTIGFGIFAAVKDTKPKDGKVTATGKIAITGIILSGLLTIIVKSSSFYNKIKQQKLEIAALHVKDSLDKIKYENQIRFQDSVANSLRISLNSLSLVGKKQDTSLSSLNLITTQQSNTFKKTNRQILRAYYPLQPMTLSYDIEYPINQTKFKEFAARVKPLILKFYKDKWGDNGRFKDSFLDTGFYAKVNLSFNKDWLPDKEKRDERDLAYELLEDNTIFDFVSSDEMGIKHLKFLAVPEEQAGVLLSLPYKDKPSQEVKIGIDFEKNVITKHVVSHNPLRSGNDLLPVSSVDLIGKKLIWSAIIMKQATWSLVKLKITFPYDYDEDSGSVTELSPNREVKINKGQKSLIIQPTQIGFRPNMFDN